MRNSSSSSSSSKGKSSAAAPKSGGGAVSYSSSKTSCCVKVGLKRGPWTPEEDELLTNYINKEGEGRWRTLPKRAGCLRCGKSCRLRWMNYLRPSVKRGQIAADEEDLILRFLGNASVRPSITFQFGSLYFHHAFNSSFFWEMCFRRGSVLEEGNVKQGTLPCNLGNYS